MNQTGPAIKRFYKSVSVEKEGRSWTILLDEKSVRTPARSILRLPTEGLAKLLADEWEAQRDVIHPQNMPMTRLANVAHDHMGTAKAASAGELVRFAASDLLCFRVAEPLDLQELQAQKWDKWLDWTADIFGARLGVTTNLRTPSMPLAALENMRNTALEMHAFTLTPLVHVSAMLASAVLGFALVKGELDADEAFVLSRIEEDWQIGQWGEDEEAKIRADALLVSLRASVAFMRAAPVACS
ncbi:hypothetical protein MNBD_ALPHA06-1547 [hydrothermal vent metagenome]|uniref:Chaperone required for the assembly of the mitochondrial F1-ATPase n=1 Tax=hydrothermal vent metagenome TaxID=652676 RepID=A0A3B0RQQ8_9ZZZZ